MLFQRKIPLLSGIFLFKTVLTAAWNTHLHCLFTIKQFDISKLFIRNTHNSDTSMLWNKRFNLFYMHSCILATGTMTDIDRKLKHCKSILCRFFLKSAYAFFSFFVSVGKSNNTSTHITRYSLNRSITTFPDKKFCATLH